jgi:putative transposase
MVRYQLKLRLNRSQEKILEEWLWHLTGVWNWAVRKIEQDAQGGIYYSEYDMMGLVAGHSKRMGIPSHTLRALASRAQVTWQRCFKKKGGKPHLKGIRNRLNDVPFPGMFNSPKRNRIHVTKLGWVRFHKQKLPEGKLKCGSIIKRASGWYLCLVIDTEPQPIPTTGHGQVGIDPGFKHLLTLSNGKKVEHPRELEQGTERLVQAQRGKNKKLVARLQERTANRRKDRNHKLSRHLVSENSEVEGRS